MNKYQGNCHCGAISFTFSCPEINEGLRCNCSICERKGAVMSVFTLSPEQMDIRIEKDALSTYQFGTKVAKHHFCNKCGMYVFHETIRKIGHYRLNLGCVNGVNSLDIPTEIFDGASLQMQFNNMQSCHPIVNGYKNSRT